MRRNPILSEGDAFGVTLTITAITAIAVLVGWLVSGLVGVAVFLVLVAAALAAYMGTPERRRRRPLRIAAREPHPLRGPRGRRHVLVVANEALAGERLAERMRRLDARTVEFDILAPVLGSRAHLAFTDLDAETEDARRRLARSVAWARAQGFTVHGAVGEAGPATAIEDQLRLHGAEQIIIFTGDGDHWQERNDLKRVRQELDVPVHEIAAESAGGAETSSARR
jgi:hypothetical protein